MLVRTASSQPGYRRRVLDAEGPMSEQVLRETMAGCELCGRAFETTRHHLIPKNRKDSPIAQLCKPCHKQVHATFTHHELKQEYNTVSRLRDADRLQSFLAWIKKTDKTDIRVRETEHVRNWRR